MWYLTVARRGLEARGCLFLRSALGSMPVGDRKKSWCHACEPPACESYYELLTPTHLLSLAGL